jgi:signal transduction histidine kinase
MHSGVESWSTQQLAEFLTVVASFSDERSAVQGALDRTAEAMEAEIAALIVRGEVEASIGFAAGNVVSGALLAVATGTTKTIEIEGLGSCDAISISLEDDWGSRLVVARYGGGGYSQEERDLLRGMARVLDLTLRMLGSLADERALRAKAEAEMAERKRIQKEADRLRNDFFASLSHELRTPLTSIIGYTDLLLTGTAGDLTPQQREFLQVTERNARRELRLVNDLLFASMTGHRKFKIDRARVDLQAVVTECVAACEPMAEKKNVQLSCRVPSSRELSGDKDRLAQLLDNLLSNAVKFTPAGGRAEIRLNEAGDLVRLEVWNSDSYVAPEERDQLFERFYRSREAAEQVIPGVGLGLAISKAIVEAHDGTISVQSEPGSGTSFIVELPVDGGAAPTKPQAVTRAA